MEEKKGVFHFYSLKWHNRRSSSANNVYTYSNKEKEKIFNSLRNSAFFPDESDPGRYKIHGVKYLDDKGILYGYFVHYYNEHIKTIENPNGKDEITSEWYLFIYLIDDNRIVFQHKKGIGDRPGISDVKSRFIQYFKNQLMFAGLATPVDWEKEELGRDRIEFLEVFFNKQNRVSFLEVEDFDKLNLRSQKIISGDQKFSYFNPIFDEGDTAIRTEDYQNEHLKSFKAEAREGGTLGKVPACRIATASANKFKKMKFYKQGSYEEETYIEKGSSSIEGEIDSEIEISEVYLNHIITLIQSFVRGKKAKVEGEEYIENQPSLLND